MLEAYWHVGHQVVEEEQGGLYKVDYGSNMIKYLSERLTRELGSGYDRTNLQHMRKFFLTFQNCDALRRELS